MVYDTDSVGWQSVFFLKTLPLVIFRISRPTVDFRKRSLVTLYAEDIYLSPAERSWFDFLDGPDDMPA
jgi:hypothetical protein